MTSEVTQAALEPCPFCGGMASEETSKGPTGERYRWVQCEKCGAMSECCDDSARANNPDEPEPVLLWNTRLTAPSGEGRSGAGDDAVEAVAQWLHDEGGFGDSFSGRTWPEHPDDTGQREGGWVKLVPSDVQAKFRDVARRLLTQPAAAALNARQSGEGEREGSLAIVECSDPNEGWSLSIKFGSGDHARDKMRAFSDRLRAGEV